MRRRGWAGPPGGSRRCDVAACAGARSGRRCQAVGCASVNITLSESLQRQMNLYFPEEKLKVVDVTEHVETESSYHGPELGAD